MITKDITKLQLIYLEARLSIFDWHPPERFKLEDFEKSIKGEWVFVAIIDDEVVGFCSIWLPDNFVHNLFVAPNHQGKNIGIFLLNHAFNNGLNKPARLKCTVKNTKACGFYKAQGWEIEEANVEGKNDHYHLFQLH